MHRESKRERERETEKLCEQVWVRDGEKHTSEILLFYFVESVRLRISQAPL